jgi:signal transduction histidine kinase
MAVTLFLSAASLYLVISRTMHSDIDQSVMAKANDLASTIGIRGGLSPDTSHLVLPNIDAFTSLDTYIQVLDASGKLVDKSTNLGAASLPVSPASLQTARLKGGYYEFVELSRERLRMYTVPIVLAGQIFGYVQVARSTRVIDTTLSSVLYGLAAGHTVLLLLAMAVGSAIARASLRPIHKLTQTVRELGRSGRLDQRLEYHGPQDEVGRLATTFNDMLESISKLLNSQRRFVADASHELRTPLTSLRVNVETLKKQLANHPESLEVLSDVSAELERMSRLVNGLLDLARADAGLHLERKKIDLSQVVTEVYQKALTAQNGVHISLTRLEPVQVLGNSDYLHNALYVLVDNAIKYTPSGGHVWISLDRFDRWARATVTDDGMGISPEDLPHIFERFYRAKGARRKGGTGLGLSIAQWVAHEHGGQITVDSAPGKGSTFVLWLPVCEELPQPPAIRQPGKKKRRS